MEDRIVVNQVEGVSIEAVIAQIEAARKNGKVIRHYTVDGSHILILEQPYEDMMADYQGDMDFSDIEDDADA